MTFQMQLIFNNTPKGKRNICIAALSVPLFLLIVGYGFHTLWHSFSSPKDEASECAAQYSFLRNDMDCTMVMSPNKMDDPLLNKVQHYVDTQIARGNATRVSVFYRDLIDPRTVDVYPNERFSPASLMKLPLAITYLKFSEVNPAILTKELVYQRTGEYTVPETFQPPSRMVHGEKYLVGPLIERMIEYSDNDALALLIQHIDQEFIKKVYYDLTQSRITDVRTTGDFLSARIYGNILYKLYNASYLNPDNSQKIISIMTRVAFDEGLMAGLPDKTTQLANKFGERSITNAADQNITAQLHDCGIVYKPNHPYIICVMTEGHSFEKLTKVISGVSKIMYENQ
jgi:beta-lactamase class A